NLEVATKPRAPGTSATGLPSGEPVPSAPTAAVQHEQASMGEALAGRAATAVAAAEGTSAAPNVVAEPAMASAGSGLEDAAATMPPGTNATVLATGQPLTST